MRSEYACIVKLFFFSPLNDLSCPYFLSKKLEKKHKESVIAQGVGPSRKALWRGGGQLDFEGREEGDGGASSGRALLT